MREGILTASTFCLILGAIFFMLGQQRVDNALWALQYYQQVMFEGNILRMVGIIFFISGVIGVFRGVIAKEKPKKIKHKPIITQELPMNSNESTEGRLMYNRTDLIFGIIFIGIGFIVLISTLLVEPIVGPVELPYWFFVFFQIIALVCVVVGIVGIITALIPKKQ